MHYEFWANFYMILTSKINILYYRIGIVLLQLTNILYKINKNGGEFILRSRECDSMPSKCLALTKLNPLSLVQFYHGSMK